VTVALLFAGQGVEPPWIDRALLERAASRPLVEAASDASGLRAGALLLDGGLALARSEVLQPLLVAACLMAAAAIEEQGVVPALVCGHSLGELSAWAASGAIAATDAIAVAGVRGRLMAREAARRPGGMAALGPDVELARVLAAAAPHGRLVLAAENTPHERVVSGDAAAIAAVVAAFPSRRLPVAGAWHSPAMAGAVEELHAALAAIPRRPARAPLVSNRDGAIAAADDVPRRLAEQLVHPVRWTAALATLAARGVTRHVIAGPGRLLRGLVRDNLGAVDVQIVDRGRDLVRVAA
jgi:[acyl-carrier-protein] S-malonyltransferase